MLPASAKTGGFLELARGAEAPGALVSCGRTHMAYTTRSYARGYSDSGGLPPAIKWLLIVNVGIYLLQFFWSWRAGGDRSRYFALRPVDVVTHLFVWQLVTYMFLHGGIFHIAFNMFALWIFGVQLEQAFGTRRFLNFYFFCGIGAGVCVVLASLSVRESGGVRRSDRRERFTGC